MDKRDPVKQTPEEVDHLLPLKPIRFHLLVAIAEGNQHGYRIRKVVEERTRGGIRLWPATLYGTLRSMVGEGWLQEREEDRTAGELRRRCYRLTPIGERLLAAETKRLDELVRSALATPALQRGRPQ